VLGILLSIAAQLWRGLAVRIVRWSGRGTGHPVFPAITKRLWLETATAHAALPHLREHSSSPIQGPLSFSIQKALRDYPDTAKYC